MAEELWVEGAGGKRGAEGPAGWQRVGWTEVVRAEWVEPSAVERGPNNSFLITLERVIDK